MDLPTNLALIDRLVAHCQAARFTGILRMRAREGIGEVWFLSGMVDEIHFGVSTADEAMDRMRKAADATFELVSRLPHPGGGFKRSFPAKGSIATATPVTLMRYCEQYALTCTLAVESRGVLVEATYELGDLVLVETTADDDGITAMLEAQEGTYEFVLASVELPEGTPVLPPASSRLESMPPPESMGFRALLEAKPTIRPASDEAEVKRKTVEIAHRQKATATTPNVPRPVAKSPAAPPAAEKREPEKPKATKPEPEKRAAEKSRAPKPEAEKREPEKVEAPKQEAKKPEPEKLEVQKQEAKESEPEKSEAQKEEAESRDEERAAAPEEKPRAEKPASARAKREPESAEALPIKNGPWTWVVVSLLVAAALGYLFLTHRI